jgi:hypothetical protein
MEQPRPEVWQTMPPPREVFTIGGNHFNILTALRQDQTVHYPSDQPGDQEAFGSVSRLQNISTTPKEYITAMPRLLEYMVKKDGRWDADLITVTQFLIDYTIERTPGGTRVLYSEDTRLALFANVYGKLEAIKGTLWNDPRTADAKADLIRKAKDYVERPRQ